MKNLLPLLLMIGSLGLVGCGGSGPGDTIKDFAYGMEAGDAEKVEKAAPALRVLAGNDEKFEAFVKDGAEDIKKDGGIKSITIDKEAIDGDSAKVTATLESGNGDKQTEDFTLEKNDDGDWVITLGIEDKGGMPTPDMGDMPEINIGESN